MPCFSSRRDSFSDFSTEIVPTSTGWPLRVPFGDVFDRGFVLAVLAFVDEVRAVVADHRAVRRDRHDLEVVGVRELSGFRRRGTGHAAELVVHPEVVLDGDRRERLVLFLDLDVLLGLDRLVETFAPTTTFEDATGELVDDLHLAVAHDVVDVALEQFLRAQRLLQLVDEVLVDVLVEVVDRERLFDLRDAFLGGDDRALGFVDLVVRLRS